MAATNYGQISPRTAAFVVKDLLERGMPFMVFEKFGQSKPIPKNETKTITFRRYFLETSGIGSVDTTSPYTLASWQNDTTQDYTPYEYHQGTGNQFDPASKTLTEGVTPDATRLASEDISATLVQYGDLTTITDVILDTHEDPILKEATEVLGEQAAILIEKVRYNALVAGSNVFYANGTATTAVNTKYSLLLQRKVTRTMKRNLAKPITKIVRSTAAYATQNVAPGFVCVCHSDCEPDIRGLSGFVAAENYGSVSPWENEIGKVEDVRYVASTIMTPLSTAGATSGTAVLEDDDSKAIVYPMLFFAKDAYGIVPLKGGSSMTPMVVNPTPSDSDPLAQRGHVSWKAWQSCIILNDAWMARVECAVTDLSA